MQKNEISAKLLNTDAKIRIEKLWQVILIQDQSCLVTEGILTLKQPL